MKREILALCMLSLIWNSVSAQDSLTVSFSEEQDTLVKQRFIDRHENVFMTKVPTKSMVKLSAVDSRFAGTGIFASYEHKILPSWSLEAGVYAQLLMINNSLVSELRKLKTENISYWAIVKARWYFDMRRRMQLGLNSNNFTGMYLGMNYEYLWKNPYTRVTGHVLGLTLGFKTRFLNHGNLDLGINLYSRQLGWGTMNGDYQSIFKPKYFVLSTHKTYGIAFGDWKRNPNPTVCDVLVCDEDILSQWKFGLPDISISLTKQLVAVTAAYERKIGKTPLSIQLMNESTLSSYTNSGLFGSILTDLQLRYYFLQSLRLRKGLGGSNFSGLYLVGAAEYYQGWNAKEKFSYSNNRYYAMQTAKLGLGFQQRLLSKVFIDGALFYQENYIPRSWNNSLGRSKNRQFSSKLTIGFTL
ncbi:hypothetical protein J2Y45_002238 [Dyadobacter sp. BE34]|uniref:Outer membrane protein n=1 Tax=Dyadobacter fermentans TaxID=94254 RepID=A0ABU1QWC0_9BACT|nr:MULTISPECIES: hypothetical protein [Dyadobacter]MDR6805453.1 hypothetical protein [Dyadobacter fermentans]MDR7042787.1 hypothetical protein [Dyadobacter sp. BE242]MDR7197099.1 hypothetical protein [Dyadobacter sp. BE34]MDR7215466.1 hypothetical protein [Dyadobacter sp. BE31]MDR7263002.1 hypothetical protein [Dyadobacter sp. BE32]